MVQSLPRLHSEFGAMKPQWICTRETAVAPRRVCEEVAFRDSGSSHQGAHYTPCCAFTCAVLRHQHPKRQDNPTQPVPRECNQRVCTQIIQQGTSALGTQKWQPVCSTHPSADWFHSKLASCLWPCKTGTMTLLGTTQAQGLQALLCLLRIFSLVSG